MIEENGGQAKVAFGYYQKGQQPGDPMSRQNYARLSNDLAACEQQGKQMQARGATFKEKHSVMNAYAARCGKFGTMVPVFVRK